MTRYIWSREQHRFIDRDGKPMEIDESCSSVVTPMIQSDITAYESPLGTGMIDGRKARREDLKRAGCREVDPSEYTPTFKNESFARKRGLPFEG